MNVLFLCTGNSCRSQMAEGWARHLDMPDICPHSAGTVAKGLDPRALKVMAEVGVDVSGQRSKSLDDLAGVSFDHVITLCGHALETCPVFPGATRVSHQSFDDPPMLAEGSASEEEALEHYRRIRDEIMDFVKGIPQWLREAEVPPAG